MAKQKIFDSKVEQDLKRDIVNMFNATMSAYCKKAADELTETAKYAISEFYKDYQPDWYDRTYNLKNNSYKRYYKNHSSHFTGRFTGGVYIGTDYMKTYYKETQDGLVERDPFIVASTAWEGGLHGIYGWHTEEGRNGVIPMKIIDDKMKDEKFLSELEDVARTAMYKQKYKYLGNFI